MLASRETLAIMGIRYGEEFAGSTQEARPGETVRIGEVHVSFHPAGHVLGSMQVAIRQGGLRVVVSGDYKRQSDPTCAPFELVPCDVFITEATFGLPVFRHPPAETECAKLLASLSLFPGRTHLVGAYALGKAQRVIAELRRPAMSDRSTCMGRWSAFARSTRRKGSTSDRWNPSGGGERNLPARSSCVRPANSPTDGRAASAIR